MVVFYEMSGEGSVESRVLKVFFVFSKSSAAQKKNNLLFRKLLTIMFPATFHLVLKFRIEIGAELIKQNW